MSNRNLDPELMQALWEAGKAAARHLGLGEPEYMTICGGGQPPMSEETNPRDTQFKGFAELLAAEIANTDGWMLSDVEKLIARRAYDLVNHTLWYSTPASGSTILKHKGLTIEEITNVIPDLTEWPKEEEQDETATAHPGTD